MIQILSCPLGHNSAVAIARDSTPRAMAKVATMRSSLKNTASQRVFLKGISRYRRASIANAAPQTVCSASGSIQVCWYRSLSAQL